jgi:hypothetical protein
LPPILSRKNIVLAGIWFGKGKPNMSSYMSAFATEIKKVNNEGICWTHPNKKKHYLSCLSNNKLM